VIGYFPDLLDVPVRNFVPSKKMVRGEILAGFTCTTQLATFRLVIFEGPLIVTLEDEAEAGETGNSEAAAKTKKAVRADSRILLI